MKVLFPWGEVANLVRAVETVIPARWVADAMRASQPTLDQNDSRGLSRTAAGGSRRRADSLSARLMPTCRQHHNGKMRFGDQRSCAIADGREGGSGCSLRNRPSFLFAVKLRKKRSRPASHPPSPPMACSAHVRASQKSVCSSMRPSWKQKRDVIS